MGRYANSTAVSPETSRAEIERTLRRYGADGFGYAWQGDRAQIQFTMRGKYIRFELKMPAYKDFKFTEVRGSERSQAAQEKAYSQAVAQKWRALALVIKAKLEAVESEISIFEDEFLANIVLPSGETVGGWMRPQIEAAYELGEMPKLLPGGKP